MILLFHDIGFANNKYTITPEDFKKILNKYPFAEIHFDDGRKGILAFGASILANLNRTATIFLVPNWILGNAPEQEKYSKFLDKKEIKQLIKKGFEIGSHSCNHVDLTKYLPVFVEQDLRDSKMWLEKTFEIKVNKFSYPFGKVNEKIQSIACKIYKQTYTIESDLGIQRKLVIDDKPKS